MAFDDFMATKARRWKTVSFSVSACIIAALIPMVPWASVVPAARAVVWPPPPPEAPPAVEGHYHGTQFHAGPEGSCKCGMMNFGENNAY